MWVCENIHMYGYICADVYIQLDRYPARLSTSDWMGTSTWKGVDAGYAHTQASAERTLLSQEHGENIANN